MTFKMPETDLITIAERELISKARTWYAIWREEATWDGHKSEAKRLERLHEAECEVLAAITLLESREKDTEHLEGK